MRILSKIIVTLGFVGAMACGGATLTHAQGIYFGAPGVEFGVGQPYRERNYDRGYRSYEGDRYQSYEGDRSYYGGPYVSVRPEWNERRTRNGRDWN